MFSLALNGHTIAILNPQGIIAAQQRNLIIFASLLSLLIVIPVFALTFYISFKYRASNTKARYTPEWDHNTKLEFFWWAIPSIIILVLAGITWKSSHDLDPFKPLASTTPAITIQVVALPWKWLFIYPEQQIATVNYVKFPEQTPVNFEITADAPMNSFWIPQLGGQIYAMAGMSTQLHLMADHAASYSGSSANLSGKGFAGMTFMAESTSAANFSTWVNTIQDSSNQLSFDEYHQLAIASENHPRQDYASVQPNLYHEIMMQYMAPMHDMPAMGHEFHLEGHH